MSNSPILWFGVTTDVDLGNSKYMKSKYIAVDFDGTCVTHEYPKVGRDIGAQGVLRSLREQGHKLILFTMRTGKELEDALDWFGTNKVDLYGVNENPSQASWSSSRKVYAHTYIDDAALGVPLLRNEAWGEKPFVNWDKVERLLEEEGYLPIKTKTKTSEQY